MTMTNKSPMDQLIEGNPDAEVIKDDFRCQISTDGMLFLVLKKETLEKLLAAADEKGEAVIVVNTTKLLSH